MKYVKLGKTDLTVSTMTLGCWAFAGGDLWGPQDEADSIATVHAALDVGINFFDTAEGYGRGYSEEVLGRALVGRRNKAVIATKVGRENLLPEAVQQACENSLRRLQTDYIDLYQIHWRDHAIPLADTWAALEKLRDQGKVQAIGVCNFGMQDLAELVNTGRSETNQIPYNLLWRAIEFKVRQKCIEEGIGILPYSVLMQALLTGKYASPDDVPEGRARSRHFSKNRPRSRHSEAGCEAETFAAIEEIRRISQKIEQPMANVSMAWLLHQPGITSIIVGARHPGQIERNVKAVNLALAPDIIAELNEATEEVKQKLGPNPDIWQSTSRFR
ncbi:MAG: aldo/keto reductase [Anaerolineae bacterium]|nr:aldo/keto reductase [Anaerolineae bacterium]